MEAVRFAPAVEKLRLCDRREPELRPDTVEEEELAASRHQSSWLVEQNSSTRSAGAGDLFCLLFYVFATLLENMREVQI